MNERVRFDGKRTSWLVRAATKDGRYVLCTCSLFGRVHYTIIDNTLLFFGNDKRTDWSEPRSICLSCPVRQPCLADALRTEPTVGYMHGMRGGLTPAERARLVKR